MNSNSNYPPGVFFDIETLINVAQPNKILLLGDISGDFLDDYIAQKSLLNQNISIQHISTGNINSLFDLDERFDVGVIINLFEHLEKTQAANILSRLRDVLSPQYCLCLPLSSSLDDEKFDHSWELNELFSFALKKVAIYEHNDKKFGLFKYNISDYKTTPDWLNADNWANPEMWGKYWW